MIRVTITMHALPPKCKELLQTLYELMRVMQQNCGYLKTRLTIDVQNPNTFIFMEEWENQQTMESYMQSEYFSVLQGAMKLLTTSSEMTIVPVENAVTPATGLSTKDMGKERYAMNTLKPT